MNATSLGEFRSSRDEAADEKLDQIREILLGDYKRRSDAHVQLLEDRIRELEVSVHRRLDALQARLDAVTAEMDALNRTALDEIAQGMQELGDRVRRIPRS